MQYLSLVRFFFYFVPKRDVLRFVKTLILILQGKNSNRLYRKATEKVQGEKMSYRCRVHAKELVSLLCNDCDSPVCLDCLTTSHSGHKLCKLSECIEETINQLNDVIEENESARFSVKKIEENIQNNQDRLKRQVDDTTCHGERRRDSERGEKCLPADD